MPETDTLAALGGAPIRTAPWPRWPVYDETDRARLLEAFESGVWGVRGEHKPVLEQAWSAAHGTSYAVACCNGTIGLQIALLAAGVEPGDEVITTSYSFMATALAVMAVGAVPVLVDVEPETHNIDPDAVEAAIGARTRCILPVHIGGRPADMDRLLAIAKRHELVVVEDACQAWLARWRDEPVGALGAAGMFSFQSSKNITAGEGGVVVTNDEALWQRAWSLHNCGRTQGGGWYEHDMPGLNWRMGELQAALLRAQLERLPTAQTQRRSAMARLDTLFSERIAEDPVFEGLAIAPHDPRVTAHGAHIYMVRLPADLGVGKMTVIKALNAEGIPANPGYPKPLGDFGFWPWYEARRTVGPETWGASVRADYRSRDVAVCADLCARTVWIKQDVLLAGPEAMPDVVDAFARVLRAVRGGVWTDAHVR
jgi:dTDP-4-amino-4,6-dideoxygalactose transaminase